MLSMMSNSLRSVFLLLATSLSHCKFETSMFVGRWTPVHSKLFLISCELISLGVPQTCLDQQQMSEESESKPFSGMSTMRKSTQTSVCLLASVNCLLRILAILGMLVRSSFSVGKSVFSTWMDNFSRVVTLAKVLAQVRNLSSQSKYILRCLSYWKLLVA